MDFYSLNYGDNIPSNVSVIITEKAKKAQNQNINFPQVIEAEYDTVEQSIEKAIIILKGYQGEFKNIIISIDPGKKPGLAVVGDNSIIAIRHLGSPEDVVGAIVDITTTYRGRKVIIKVGNGGGIYRSRILKSIQDELDFPIMVVDERSTTPALGIKDYPSHVKDVVAAINIALKQGELLEEKVLLHPKPGEIKNIQNVSRIISGNITISRELAEKVAKGKISIEDAIEKQRANP